MNVKDMGTQTIMVYAEMVTKTYEELNQFGADVTLCFSYGGIEEKEKKEIQKVLSAKMDELDKARISLVKEINSRLKKNMGISFGPSDVQPLLNKYVLKHPNLGKGEAEIKALKEKERQDKEAESKMKKA